MRILLGLAWLSAVVHAQDPLPSALFSVTCTRVL
jgi:hypothetical protein